MASASSEVQARDPSDKRRFTYIDGLRGIAALAVTFYHFYGALGPGQWTVSPLHELLSHGDLGVEIFFVISGFVIAYSVSAARLSASFIGRFAVRRSLRLDPLYWTMLLLCFLAMRAVGSQRGEIDAWTFLANMFYLDNLLGKTSIMSVGWTLCLEVQFYLVFVLLSSLAQRLAARTGGIAMARSVVFGPLLLLSLSVSVWPRILPVEGLFVPYWFMFFLGALSFWFSAKENSFWPVALITVLVLVSLLLRWDLQPIVATATALSVCAVARAGGLKHVFSGRVLQYFGRISYSLYLVHPLVGNRVLRFVVARFHEPPSVLVKWGLFAAVLALSVAVSELLWRLVERPSLELSKRWGARFSRPKPAVAGAG